MLVEGSPVPRIERDHGHRDRISLVLEKQRQVVRFDIAQLDLCFHWNLKCCRINFEIRSTKSETMTKCSKKEIRNGLRLFIRSFVI
jgi:hypothetical protein